MDEDPAVDEERDALRAQLQQMHEELRSKQQDFDTLHQERDALQQERDTLRQNIAFTEPQSNGTAADHNLQAQLSSVCSDRDALRKELAASQELLASVRLELSGVSNRTSAEPSSGAQQIESLLQEKQKNLALIQTLQSKVADMQLRREDLEVEVLEDYFEQELAGVHSAILGEKDKLIETQLEEKKVGLELSFNINAD